MFLSERSPNFSKNVLLVPKFWVLRGQNFAPSPKLGGGGAKSWIWPVGVGELPPPLI